MDLVERVEQNQARSTALVEGLVRELAALKARSCSGCRWYTEKIPDPLTGKAGEFDQHRCEMSLNGYCDEFFDDFNPDKDSCSRWEKGG